MPTNDATAETAENTGAENAKVEFEKWLEQQPSEVKAAYEEHVGGLKSALEKERKANKKTKPPKAIEAMRDKVMAAKTATKAAPPQKISTPPAKRAATLADRVRNVAEQKRIAKLQQDNKRLLAQQRERDARDALQQQADGMGLNFINHAARRDAIEFALKAAEFDESGKVGNAKAALEAATKDRPFLLAQQSRPIPETNAAKRGASKTTQDPAYEQQIKSRLRLK